MRARSAAFMLQNIRTEAIPDPTCDGFVYCHGTVTQIPKGFCLKARGCEERATPGPRPSRFNLEEVVASRDMDLQPDVWCSGDNRRNSVGVERYGGFPPQVARSSQPGAGGRNPFGITMGFHAKCAWSHCIDAHLCCRLSDHSRSRDSSSIQPPRTFCGRNPALRHANAT